MPEINDPAPLQDPEPDPASPTVAPQTPPRSVEHPYEYPYGLDPWYVSWAVDSPVVASELRPWNPSGLR